MVKTSKVPLAEAEKTYAKIPERKIGQWTEICNEVIKSRTAVEVTDLTSGQVAALKRRVKEMGLRAKSYDKGTKVLVLPAEPQK